MLVGPRQGFEKDGGEDERVITSSRAVVAAVAPWLAAAAEKVVLTPYPLRPELVGALALDRCSWCLSCNGYQLKEVLECCRVVANPPEVCSEC